MQEYQLSMTFDDAEFVVDEMLGARSPKLASRAVLGATQGRRVNADRATSDPDLGDIATGLLDADFYLLYFACGLNERNGEQIEDATFSVELSASIGTALAWDLDPEQVTAQPTSVEVNTSAELSIGAELTASVASIKLGPNLKFVRERTESYQEQEWLIQATGLMRADPEWQFERRVRRSLDGNHHLKLIAQVPRGAQLEVRTELTATIVKPGFAPAFARILPKNRVSDDPQHYRIGYSGPPA